MRLINNGNYPKYSGLARTTIKPGCSSRELDAFEKAFGSFEKSVKGFDAVLSDSDAELLYKMCVKYILPAFKDKVKGVGLVDEQAMSRLRKTMGDPDGTRIFREAYREYHMAVQKVRASIISEARAKEARIKAESNIIGTDGNPIPNADIAAEKVSDVKPELHPEMTTDLKSIIANNLAVMTTASGQPIRSAHDVVAKPGGSPVSHNPKDYQKPRSAPPGQPEYFK